jgi:phenylacetate-coenzyme A ligase PaaK-like adenylate-forming protein
LFDVPNPKATTILQIPENVSNNVPFWKAKERAEDTSQAKIKTTGNCREFGNTSKEIVNSTCTANGRVFIISTNPRPHIQHL